MPILCPNCGSSLSFDPDARKLLCPSCGSGQDVIHTNDMGLVDLERIYTDTKELEGMDLNVYTCSTCGGSITVNDVEMTSACPFCGNHGVIFDRIAKRRRPDAVIPFSIGADKALQAVREHLKRSALLSSNARNMELSKPVGVYIPYFVISAESKGVITYEKVTRNKNGREIDRDHIAKSFRCVYDRLTLEASSAFPDEASIEIEPYDFKDLRTFEEGYLQGFCSDMADDDPGRLLRKAKGLCREYEIGEIARKNICPKGYHSIGHEYDVKFKGKAVYSLFPVWFVIGKYGKDRKVTILVNGQTGKVVGGPPYSKVKMTGSVLLASILPTAVFTALGAGGAFLAFKTITFDLRLTALIIPGLVFLGSFIIAKAEKNVKRLKHILDLSSSKKLGSFAGRRISK